MDMSGATHDSAGSATATTGGRLMDHWSIEVLPRTAAKIGSFSTLLPPKTRVYLAHVDGTPLDDMVATARRLHREGFAVMPHIPARSIPNLSELSDLLNRYRSEADVRQALLLAGGRSTPAGSLESSLDLIETGLFDQMGFTDLHVAGHPEGNGDIDRNGSTDRVDAALATKQDYANRTDARMALTTQFAFDADGIIRWSERIAALGIALPIHVGVAGPTKIQTLLKYAIACGVGASLKVIQKRALDVTKLFLPYEPTEVVQALEAYKARAPETLISRIHLFPLGGIEPAVDWAKQQARR